MVIYKIKNRLIHLNMKKNNLLSLPAFLVAACMFPVISYAQTKMGFEKVTVSNVEWYDEGASAKCAGDTTRYKFATIIENKDVGTANIFKGSDCAVEFTAKTRSDVDMARITEVVVDVLEFKPAVNCITKVPAPAEIKDVIYVKIKKPLNKSESFKATQYFENGELKKFTGWRVVKDNPERLMVRINATEEGLYKLRVKIKSNSHSEKDSEGIETAVGEVLWWYFGR